jgi:hypothetical protein
VGLSRGQIRLYCQRSPLLPSLICKHRNSSPTNSNSEDYFSDHPKRLPSFDRLLRSEAQLTPEDFFRTLERQSGENHCTEDDYQRAVFSFRRLQSTWNISKLSLFLVAMSLVPFVCVRLPEEWCLSALTSGIVLEFFPGAILYFAHSQWQARRRDYCLWLRLVHGRANDL